MIDSETLIQIGLVVVAFCLAMAIDFDRRV